ncbi:flagellar hook-basal body complex protein FliE [Buchnera aphidicola]|uniref:flagellar hook-basal body complex protein FliE n=1 Tax=Buchnera aphidicola TaxID=9 RepID=UPI003464978A
MSIHNINNIKKINFNILTSVEKKNKLLSNDFSYLIKNILNKIDLIQKNAKESSKNLMLEKKGVSLSDVMIDLQKSTISMHLAVQIRNKLVSGYQEIMNMQV